MKIAIVLLSILAFGHCAQAQDAEKYVTSGEGVLCVRFSDLREALKALISGDIAWVRSLDCVKVMEGMPVTVIEQIQSTSDGNPWKVRITLPSGRGASVWGPVFAFKKIPADGSKN